MKHEPKERPEIEPSQPTPEIPVLPNVEPVKITPEIDPMPDSEPEPETDAQ
jgi:hypothetical protein